jgi:type VI secretion system secreted protein VgrG
MNPLYELHGDLLPPSAQVVSIEGEEALNRPYRFRVLFRVPLAEGLSLDLDGVTGTTARLSLHDEGTGALRHTYSGTVAALELVEDLQRFSLLRLHLVPRLWRLGLGEHSRVFVDTALPEILSQTLEDGGLTSSDYELRLTGSYRPLAHVCQVRESRLTFVTRWLERVGAYYFFEHGEEQEKLVIADSTSSYWSCQEKPVRFTQHQSDAARQESLLRFRWRHSVLPRKVAVADYSPLNPLLRITGSADVLPEGIGGEVNLFKVNEELPGDAARHARTRALEHLAGRTTCHADGRVFGLVPGFTFDLVEHPRSELNQTYLVTEARHRGAASGSGPEAHEDYHCELKAIPASEQWLPSTTTSWPRIAGTVRARVDGEAESEFAQLDEHGRYLVRLMLDESGLPDGAASTRIRMSQPHAGNPEGLHFPLRKGTEVLVAFVKGDPDQPMITGVVPNTANPSPVTQSNRTQNVIQTGGLNRLELDDNQGSEYIDWSAPPEKSFLHLGAHAGLGSHNYVLSTSGDYSMHTGGNRDIKVGGVQTETVGGDVNETYHSTQTTTVDGAHTETIDGGATQTIHAGSTQSIDGGATETISGGETRTVTGGQKETLDGGRTQTITGSSTETVNGSLTQTITGGATITTPAGYTVCAAGGFELTTPGSITLIANGGFNLLAPGGQTRLDDDSTQTGGEYKIIADNQIVTSVNRVDLRGSYYEVVALKFDAFSFKLSRGGSSRQTAAISIGNGGAARVTTRATFFHKGALKLWGV